MRTLLMAPLTLVCLFGFALSARAQNDGPVPEELVERQIIVMFKTDQVKLPSNATSAGLERANMPSGVKTLLRDFDAQELAEAFPDFQRKDTTRVLDDGRIYRVPDYTNLFVITLPAGVNRDTVVARLERLPHVEYAEKNGLVTPRGAFSDAFSEDLSLIPYRTAEDMVPEQSSTFTSMMPPEVIPTNEPLFSQQWGLRNTIGPDIEATHAWTITKGSSSIKVGIVDGGVYSGHNDLSGKVSGVTANATEHGTWVAGIAAAKGQNSGGRVVGVDWNAKIVSGRTGTLTQTAQAIDDVVAAGAKVVNNSWGRDDQSNVLNQALRSAYGAGVLLVHANPYINGTKAQKSSYPNNLGPWILNVGAMRQSGERWSNTASHSFTDVAAPGESIVSTSNTGSTMTVGGSGTSGSAPFVTGTASLMLAVNANLRNYDIEHILKRTAQSWPNFNSYIGYGMIDAYAALQKVTSPNTVAHGTATFTKVADNVDIWFSSEPLPNRGAGPFRCDVWKMEATASHQYQETPWAWLSPTAKGYSYTNPNNAQPYLYESVSPTSMTLRTYFYFVEYDLDYGVTINQWAPFDPTAFRRSNGTYEYTVVGKPGTSPPSSPPSAPTGFTVTGNTGQHPLLSWNATSGATGYKIYRCMSTTTSCTNFSYLTSTSSTTYTDLNRRVGSSCSSTSGEQFTFYYVKAYNSGGDSPASATKSTCTSNNKQETADLVAAAQELLPTAYALEPNYPNPFNPSTEIRFALPEAASVRLVVYDALGREVARLVDGPMGAGYQHATFDAANLPSGVYLYRLEARGGAETFAKTGQMVLVK